MYPMMTDGKHGLCCHFFSRLIAGISGFSVQRSRVWLPADPDCERLSRG